MLRTNQLIGFGAGGAAVSPITGGYVSTANSSADTAAYTFSAQAIGTAAADRRVVVVTGCVIGGATAPTISSLTIGGVSAAQAVIAGDNLSGQSVALGVWSAIVATGTTGDVVVTWSTSAYRSFISVYSIYGTDTSVYDTLTDDSTDPLTGTIDVPAGGVIIGGHFNHTPATNVTYDAGMTEDVDSTVEGSYYSSGHDLYASASTGQTCTINLTTTPTTGCMGVASWGPA